ncbi:hypothetical protein FHY19_004444 [Xanthomonas arboricola]|nr:hypothetical protein [Xanthomonas sp. 4461]
MAKQTRNRNTSRFTASSQLHKQKRDGIRAIPFVYCVRLPVQTWHPKHTAYSVKP